MHQSSVYFLPHSDSMATYVHGRRTRSEFQLKCHVATVFSAHQRKHEYLSRRKRATRNRLSAWRTPASAWFTRHLRVPWLAMANISHVDRLLRQAPGTHASSPTNVKSTETSSLAQLSAESCCTSGAALEDRLQILRQPSSWSPTTTAQTNRLGNRIQHTHHWGIAERGRSVTGVVWVIF